MNHGSLALFCFFGGDRLLKDETETVFAITEVVRRGILASLASKAVLSHVKPTGNVLRMAPLVDDSLIIPGSVCFCVICVICGLTVPEELQQPTRGGDAR